MTKFLSVLCTASALTIAAASAQAATVQMNVTNVVGKWTAWTDGKSVTTTATGANPAELRWGKGDKKSGYDFTGLAPSGPHAEGEDFNLGIFKHLNYPIDAGSSITGATLEVSYSVYVDGDTSTLQSYTSVFEFKHWETDNGSKDWWGNWSNPTTCANGKKNGSGVNESGCADRVTAKLNAGLSDAIKTENGKYYLTVSGFSYSGEEMDEFWTKENATNSATLKASFTHERNVQPAPVPLPAAGFLLLGGLGALGAASRRRKSA